MFLPKEIIPVRHQSFPCGYVWGKVVDDSLSQRSIRRISGFIAFSLLGLFVCFSSFPDQNRAKFVIVDFVGFGPHPPSVRRENSLNCQTRDALRVT